MKINGLNTPSSINSTEAKRDAQPNQAREANSGKAAEVVSHIETPSADPSQDIDHARVAELKQAIRDGKLEVNPEKIADALLQELSAEDDV